MCPIHKIPISPIALHQSNTGTNPESMNRRTEPAMSSTKKQRGIEKLVIAV